MLKEDIEKRLLDIISEKANLTVPIFEIKFDVNLLEVGVDSISLVEIIVEIEKQFEIFIDDDDLGFENFKNINKIIKYISNQILIE